MAAIAPQPHNPDRPHRDIFAPVRYWLNRIQIRNIHLARFICKLIPPTCPFERNIHLLGHTIHIPPLCKLNPLFDEIIALRFRAVSYLADDCGLDINQRF